MGLENSYWRWIHVPWCFKRRANSSRTYGRALRMIVWWNEPIHMLRHFRTTTKTKHLLREQLQLENIYMITVRKFKSDLLYMKWNKLKLLRYLRHFSRGEFEYCIWASTSKTYFLSTYINLACFLPVWGPMQTTIRTKHHCCWNCTGVGSRRPLHFRRIANAGLRWLMTSSSSTPHRSKIILGSERMASGGHGEPRAMMSSRHDDASQARMR